MIKKGFLIVLILLFTACAGTVRMAKETKKDLITPTVNKDTVAKPNE